MGKFYKTETRDGVQYHKEIDSSEYYGCDDGYLSSEEEKRRAKKKAVLDAMKMYIGGGVILVLKLYFGWYMSLIPELIASLIGSLYIVFVFIKELVYSNPEKPMGNFRIYELPYEDKDREHKYWSKIAIILVVVYIALIASGLYTLFEFLLIIFSLVSTTMLITTVYFIGKATLMFIYKIRPKRKLEITAKKELAHQIRGEKEMNQKQKKTKREEEKIERKNLKFKKKEDKILMQKMKVKEIVQKREQELAERVSE